MLLLLRIMFPYMLVVCPDGHFHGNAECARVFFSFRPPARRAQSCDDRVGPVLAPRMERALNQQISAWPSES